MKEYVAGSKKQEEGVLGYYETDSVVYHEDGVTPKYIFHVSQAKRCHGEGLTPRSRDEQAAKEKGSPSNR